ncbi:MAG: hypothetical protein R3F30_09920 [Planctomycetota bacterium]
MKPLLGVASLLAIGLVLWAAMDRDADPVAPAREPAKATPTAEAPAVPDPVPEHVGERHSLEQASYTDEAPATEASTEVIPKEKVDPTKCIARLEDLIRTNAEQMEAFAKEKDYARYALYMYANKRYEIGLRKLKDGEFVSEPSQKYSDPYLRHLAGTDCIAVPMGVSYEGKHLHARIEFDQTEIAELASYKKATDEAARVDAEAEAAAFNRLPLEERMKRIRESDAAEEESDRLLLEARNAAGATLTTLLKRYTAARERILPDYLEVVRGDWTVVPSPRPR